jgi:hypothetical protein
MLRGHIKLLLCRLGSDGWMTVMSDAIASAQFRGDVPADVELRGAALLALSR